MRVSTLQFFLTGFVLMFILDLIFVIAVFLPDYAFLWNAFIIISVILMNLLLLNLYLIVKLNEIINRRK